MIERWRSELSARPNVDVGGVNESLSSGGFDNHKRYDKE